MGSPLTIYTYLLRITSADSDPSIPETVTVPGLATSFLVIVHFDLLVTHVMGPKPTNSRLASLPRELVASTVKDLLRAA